MRLLLAGLALVLSTAGAAQADQAGLRALMTADETKGWEAVGRLNLGESGFCTGALIAPQLVLTAAHCLFDKNTGAAYEASEIEFLAGWRNGRAAAYRNVKRTVAHPDYIYEGPDKMDRVAYDLAIMELDQPIRLPSITPFETFHDPAEGDLVDVVSYALDRSEAPSLQEQCNVLSRQPGILVLSCNVDFGSSGAPVFSLQDGVPKIVSVVSAKAEMDGQVVALGTAMEQPLAELMAALASPQRTGARAAASLTGQADGKPRSASGAKFLKP